MLGPVIVLALVAEVSISDCVFPEEGGQTEVKEVHILWQNKPDFPFPAFKPHFDFPSCPSHRGKGSGKCAT